MTAPYPIAEAARLAGLTVHQIRSYVNARLVKPCAATAAGYFLFDENCVERLRLIGAATRAGLFLREIACFVHALDGDDPQALSVARESIADTISGRQDAFAQLASLVACACGGRAAVASPIGGAATSGEPRHRSPRSARVRDFFPGLQAASEDKRS